MCLVNVLGPAGTTVVWAVGRASVAFGMLVNPLAEAVLCSLFSSARANWFELREQVGGRVFTAESFGSTFRSDLGRSIRPTGNDSYSFKILFGVRGLVSQYAG